MNNIFDIWSLICSILCIVDIAIYIPGNVCKSLVSLNYR